jgi:hypothetical protein
MKEQMIYRTGTLYAAAWRKTNISRLNHSGKKSRSGTSSNGVYPVFWESISAFS